MRQISDKEVTRLTSLVRALQGLAETLESRGVKLTAAQAERIEKYRQESRCLECDNPIVPGENVRGGCHQTCRQRVANEIKAGKITVQQAVDAGRWNTINDTPGRKPKYRREVKQAVAGLVAVAKRDKRRDKKSQKAAKGG